MDSPSLSVCRLKLDTFLQVYALKQSCWAHYSDKWLIVNDL